MKPEYTVEYLEQGRRLTLERIEDPFVYANLHVRGWRNALAVLTGRYRAAVRVSGSPETIEAVLQMDHDYVGELWSQRRQHWNETLNRAVGGFAESLPD